ncbi:MAG TPA: thiamine biosynthesis protein ThiS [Bacteroidales bacterium]|nr:thiamine biosynthesis protein ThiS [Bacteroidales bacterium]
MQVFVNDELHEAPECATIAELLTAIGVEELQGLAVAINNRVVQRSHWNDSFLKENDKVLLIRATKGG